MREGEYSVVLALEGSLNVGVRGARPDGREDLVDGDAVCSEAVGKATQSSVLAARWERTNESPK